MPIYPNQSGGSTTPTGADKSPATGNGATAAGFVTLFKPDNKYVWIYVASLAIVTSILYFSHFQNNYFPDSGSYIVPARNLLAGHGFTDAQQHPETVRTPGYPLLIVLFLWSGLTLKSLIVLQHVLRVTLVLAGTAFMVGFTGSRRKGLLTGIVLCLDFQLLEAANSLLTEMAFTMMIGAVLWLLWSESGRRSKPGLTCGAAGLLAGAAVLVRPAAVLFFLPAALYLLKARAEYRVRAAVVFVLLFLPLPLGWAARNYHETGVFTLSSIAGFNALFYRGAGALAASDPGDFRQNFARRQQELEVLACKGLEREYHQECGAIPFERKAAYYSRLGRYIVWHNPVGYGKAVVRGALVMMLDGGANTLTGITGVPWPVGMRVLMIYTVPLFCLAWLGLYAVWKNRRDFFWLAFLSIGYFVVISAGPEAYGRFRVPFIPVYIMLVIAGGDWAIRRLQFGAAPASHGHRGAGGG